MAKDNRLNKPILVLGSPIDLAFMEEFFPMKKEPEYIVGDLKWGENGTVVFIKNPNGKIRMYIQ